MGGPISDLVVRMEDVFLVDGATFPSYIVQRVAIHVVWVGGARRNGEVRVKRGLQTYG